MAKEDFKNMEEDFSVPGEDLSEEESEKKPNKEDEKLTEEKLKEILINFENRLRRIEYHLRI